MDYANIIVELTFVISLLSFVVSVVTEVTKNLSFLKKVPTELQVIVTSVIVTVGSYVGYSLNKNLPITFFCVFGAFFGSFIVALVSVRGWAFVKSIYSRVSSKNGENKNNDDKKEE